MVANILNHLQTLAEFANISIQVGVLEEDAEKVVKVRLKDEFETEVEVPIGDILYFTEYGTIYTPPRPIVQTLTNWVKSRVVELYTRAVNNYNYTTEELMLDLRQIEEEANASFPALIEAYNQEVSFVNTLAESKEQDKGSFVPAEILKNYIKCKIFLNKN